ncbi:hypothetical protein BXT86_01810 [candidate division WOR-3 bacterium 4484_100]|uniref:Polymerase beta nucleotidyltransferase domain-containing protein n=1 Tax=candidate division WOR-3 bacterium 4484_100 TaxID=1936077 RepID=A0A1V4QG61_UNCW3|nr:MAG: hypothetical protein BXT86_01810 [candidate division WOR-3 bacterium 4484_100]
MDLTNLFSRYPIIAVYLFGSYARGEQGPESDYDFGILLNPQVGPSEYADIKFSILKDLVRTLKAPVDAVIMNYQGVPLTLKFRIIRDGKIVYEKDGIIRSRFEKNILSLYLDRKYYYERHINEVIKNIAQGGLFD